MKKIILIFVIFNVFILNITGQSVINSKRVSNSDIITLQNTFSTKLNPTFSGTVTGVTSTMVGLGNASNTTDSLKPISKLTQIALNNKVDKIVGKGLSTNDFTNIYKTALDGLNTSLTLIGQADASTNNSRISITNQGYGADSRLTFSQYNYLQGSGWQSVGDILNVHGSYFGFGGNSNPQASIDLGTSGTLKIGNLAGIGKILTSDLSGNANWATLSNSNIITALGFTPYNSTNPTGYITSSNLTPYGLLTGTQSWSGVNTFSGITNFSSNVGIGTTSPVAKLDIYGTSGTLPITGSTQNVASLALSNSATFSTMYFGALTSSPYSTWIQSSARNDLSIFSSISLNPNGGNVGIGTTSPILPLTVTADNNDIGQVLITGKTNTNKNLFLGYNTTGNYGVIQAVNQGVAYNTLALSPSGGSVSVGTSVAFGRFHTRVGTNQNIVFSPDLQGTETGTSSIASINDANTGYTPLGFYASKYNFEGGNLVIGSNIDNGNKLQVNGSATIAGSVNAANSINATTGLNILGNGGFYNAASKLGIDFYSGASRFYSSGVNATTKGGYEFHGISSDGTIDAIALAINNLGNVGIATTNPYSKFQISGYGQSEGITLGDRPDIANSIATSIYVTNTGSGILNIQTSKSTIGGGITAIQPDGGSVGIGTRTPTEKLEVGGNIFLNTASPLLRYGWSGIASFNAGIYGTTFNDARYSIYSGSTATEVLSVKYLNGFVGIGTTAPISLFHSSGTVTVGSGTVPYNVGIMQLIANGGSPFANRITYGTDGTGYKFGIGKNQAGVVTDQIVIQDNGNVGIGTTSPVLPLDVVGGINVNNAYYLGGTAFAVNSTNGTTNINVRVIANTNATGTYADGMYIGYNNAGSAPTRIYDGSNSNYLAVNSATVSTGGITKFLFGNQTDNGNFAQFSGTVGFKSNIYLSGAMSMLNAQFQYWADAGGAGRRYLGLSGTNFYVGDVDNTVLNSQNIYTANTAHVFLTNNIEAARLTQGSFKFTNTLGGLGEFARISAYNTVGTAGEASSMAFIRDNMADGNYGAIAFNTKSGVERMRIGSSGNIGIGTSTPTSTIHNNGSEANSIITISAATTLGDVYYVIANSATSYLITLPAVASCVGRTYAIKALTGSKTVTAFLNSAGTSTTTLSAGTITYITSDGTNWQQF